MTRSACPVTVWSGGHHVPKPEVHTENACSAEQATSKYILSGGFIAPTSYRCFRLATETARRRRPKYPRDRPGPRASPAPAGDRSGGFPGPAQPPVQRPSTGGGGARRRAG